MRYQVREASVSGYSWEVWDSQEDVILLRSYLLKTANELSSKLERRDLTDLMREVLKVIDFYVDRDTMSPMQRYVVDLARAHDDT